MPDVEAIDDAFADLVEQQRQRLIGLVRTHGWERGARIFGCARPHVAGVACICGAQDSEASTLKERVLGAAPPS